MSIALNVKPLPCFMCNELPKVGSFLLMDLRHTGWTAMCPNKHYETDAYLDADSAVEAWNRWNDTEGYVFDDYDYDLDGEVDDG